MADDVTISELGRSLDKFAAALDKFSARLDAIGDRLDRLPQTIDDRYMRKDVMAERNRRVDGALEKQDGAIRLLEESMDRQFTKLGNNVRWLVACVLVPIALAVWALLAPHGGVG